MRTLTATASLSACLLLFGVLALRLARHIPGSQPVHRYLWAFTGGAFLLRTLNSTFHDAFATYAYLQGEKSKAWDAVIVWHPYLNHSRTLLLVAYCVVACIALVRASRGARLPSLRVSMAAATAGMGLGALVAWREEAFSYLTHFTAVAGWDSLELLALMTVLLVGLSTGLMDRALWTCLGISAFAVALSAVWFVFLSRIGLQGEWAPRVYHIQWTKVVLYMGMNGVVLLQIRRMNRGRPPRGFFDARPAAGVPSLSG